MKFYCLGYYDEKKWEKSPEAKREAFTDECFAYDELLKKGGHFGGGDGLKGTGETRTVQWKRDKAVVTDGPYATAKESLGGILILEAKNLDEAVALISNHPGIKAGPFEIRPVEDMSGVIAESAKRRARKTRKAA
ncbi:MAG TPA: YciI family protein [Candidatus Deferrimicrobiaceae bacterium]